jgi:hypothetical protein
VAAFFIDTSTGQVATQRQLHEAGIADPIEGPQKPWHRIQGTIDAQTLWYAVLRKKTRGVYIGAIAIRHQDHYASLLAQGWEEVPVDQIQAPERA